MVIPEDKIISQEEADRIKDEMSAIMSAVKMKNGDYFSCYIMLDYINKKGGAIFIHK